MEMAFIQQITYILRIVIAGVCGIVIGLERKNRSKEAGIRTHCVVACGAALMMIISKYGFADIPVGDAGIRGADGSRIASQVVSGIGFLGAGMIFVHRNTITGLTTAAGIWATSGVGMAIGAGMYTVGIATTVIIVLAQIILHLNFKWINTPRQKQLSIKEVDREDYQNYITNELLKIGVSVHDISVEKDGDSGKRNYSFSIEMPVDINEDAIMNLIDYRCSVKSI